MSQGYWGPRNTSCPCCSSGPKAKFMCLNPECKREHVTKAPKNGQPHCPFCRQPMTNMGQRWRPGRKGHRDRAPAIRRSPVSRRFRNREWLSPQEYAERGSYRQISAGEELLARLSAGR